MRTLVHLSDLHFGRIDHATVRPLSDFVNAAKPDLVAVSGDLTQRARAHEFEEAREFLDSLPNPQIVTPGNHDLALYNPISRFLRPLGMYRRYIDENLEPVYSDEEMAVMALNTARMLAVQGGRLNFAQVARIRKWLCPFREEVTKIIVTHHPFDLPAGGKKRKLVGRAENVMRRLAGCRPDVFLSGHLHLGLVGLSAVRYEVAGLSALIVQAGTATSSRGRGEVNSFNILRIDNPEIEVEQINWDSERNVFAPASNVRFRRVSGRWERAE
jgi:3',5'-cyclic AMP phosphodiesterase CpdA